MSTIRLPSVLTSGSTSFVLSLLSLSLLSLSPFVQLSPRLFSSLFYPPLSLSLIYCRVQLLINCKFLPVKVTGEQEKHYTRHTNKLMTVTILFSLSLYTQVTNINNIFNTQHSSSSSNIFTSV